MPRPRILVTRRWPEAVERRLCELFDTTLNTDDHRLSADELRAALTQPWIKEIRGKGLLNAVEVQADGGVDALDLCMKLKENGLLAKPTHETTIRFAPPLVISEAQLREVVEIIKRTFAEF